MIKMQALREISQIDISNVDKKTRNNQTKVRLCNFVDVYRNWAITEGIFRRLMPATANEAQIKRFTIHKGQVAITKDSETRDDIGISSYIADELENTVLGYHCALISANERVLLGSYLNVVLHSPYAQKYFEANASGSGQRYTLTNEIIGGLPVPLPDIAEQKIIGDFFSDIDRKIANNNATCTDLEAMAKLLYDYWFIQFDFPDENGKPYKSSGGKMVWNDALKREIPEGWILAPVKTVCNTKLGGTPDTGNAGFWNGDIPWLNSGEVDTSPVLCAEKTITEKGMRESTTSFSKAGSVIISITRYIRPAILGIDSCYNQSVVAIEPTSDFRAEFLYPFFLSQVNRYMGLRTGAQQPHINKAVIDNTVMICPPKIVLEQYYRIVEPLFEKQLLEAKSAVELAELRDFLLPLLINGQVTICAASKEEDPEPKIHNDTWYDKRFALWLENQGLAARGNVDRATLREIFDAMDDDDK